MVVLLVSLDIISGYVFLFTTLIVNTLINVEVLRASKYFIFSFESEQKKKKNIAAENEPLENLFENLRTVRALTKCYDHAPPNLERPFSTA